MNEDVTRQKVDELTQRRTRLVGLEVRDSIAMVMRRYAIDSEVLFDIINDQSKRIEALKNHEEVVTKTEKRPEYLKFAYCISVPSVYYSLILGVLELMNLPDITVSELSSLAVADPWILVKAAVLFVLAFGGGYIVFRINTAILNDRI
jgi:hypothetical protein